MSCRLGGGQTMLGFFWPHFFDALIAVLCHFDDVHSGWHLVFCYSVALFSANRSLQFFFE